MTMELYKSIDMLLKNKESVIVAIEGGSASGKTTLAKKLEQKYKCTVLHMDDFFLRPEQRTKERLTEPGGNVDRERFFDEVVIPLVNRKKINYCRFDCGTFSLLPSVEIEPGRLTIVEGTYSTHPYFERYYDFSVFLCIDSKLQQERILIRNGQNKAQRFFEEWIPMEQKYFESMKVAEKCDLVLRV